MPTKRLGKRIVDGLTEFAEAVKACDISRFRQDIMYVIPVKVISETNRRCHWVAKAKRAKGQREAARLLTQNVLSGDKPKTAHVVLWRMAPGNGGIVDDNNLPSAFKAVVDGIADALGIDDGDDRLTFEYGQEKSKEYGVRVRITLNQER